MPKWDNINGCSSTQPGEIEAWIEAILAQGKVLEIGTLYGGSAKRMADMRPKALIVSLDIFSQDGKAAGQATNSPDRWWSDRRANMRLFIGDSRQFAELCQPRTFDVVIVDGDHSEASASIDLEVALRLVKPGGVIIVHDYGRKGIEPKKGATPAVQRFCASYRFVVQKVVQCSAVSRIPHD